MIIKKNTFNTIPTIFFKSIKEKMFLGIIPSKTVETLFKPVLEDYDKILPELPKKYQKDINKILLAYPEIIKKYNIKIPPQSSISDYLKNKIKKFISKLIFISEELKSFVDNLYLHKKELVYISSFICLFGISVTYYYFGYMFNGSQIDITSQEEPEYHFVRRVEIKEKSIRKEHPSNAKPQTFLSDDTDNYTRLQPEFVNISFEVVDETIKDSYAIIAKDSNEYTPMSIPNMTAKSVYSPIIYKKCVNRLDNDIQLNLQLYSSTPNSSPTSPKLIPDISLLTPTNDSLPELFTKTSISISPLANIVNNKIRISWPLVLYSPAIDSDTTADSEKHDERRSEFYEKRTILKFPMSIAVSDDEYTIDTGHNAIAKIRPSPFIVGHELAHIDEDDSYSPPTSEQTDTIEYIPTKFGIKKIKLKKGWNLFSLPLNENVGESLDFFTDTYTDTYEVVNIPSVKLPSIVNKSIKLRNFKTEQTINNDKPIVSYNSKYPNHNVEGIMLFNDTYVRSLTSSSILTSSSRYGILFCKTLGVDGKDTSNVAGSLYKKRRYIYEQSCVKDHPYLATALKILEQAHGKDQPYAAQYLNNLAELYKAQGKYEEAEPLYQRSLGIFEKALGKDHPDVAQSLNNLAELYRAQGKYEEAEPLYQRSLGIYEKSLGKDHPKYKTVIENYSQILSEK